MATTDLLTDTEARQVLGMGPADTSKAEALARAITAVSNRLATACGTIIYGTITGELQNGGRPFVYLNSNPVASVVQVVEYNSTTAATLTAETNTTKPAAGFQFNSINGKLYRRASEVDTAFANGRQNIYVTYVAGRFTSTTTVSEVFKEAAGVTLKAWWRTYESANGNVGQFDVPQASFPTFAIPKATRELLGNEWRTGSGFVG